MAEEHDASSAQSREQGGSELKQSHLPVPDVGQERPATVLLSYAHEDTASARELQLRLNVRGMRCWRGVDDLLLGGLFESQIVQTIEREVDAMALYITPNSLKSNFIWKVEIPLHCVATVAIPIFISCPSYKESLSSKYGKRATIATWSSISLVLRLFP